MSGACVQKPLLEHAAPNSEGIQKPQTKLLKVLVEPTRFELATRYLSRSCSAILSYGPTRRGGATSPQISIQKTKQPTLWLALQNVGYFDFPRHRKKESCAEPWASAHLKVFKLSGKLSLLDWQILSFQGSGFGL